MDDLSPPKRLRDPKTGAIVNGTGDYDFDPRHGHYMKCGEVITTLASASLVLIPGLHFTAVFPWLGMSMVLLGFTVVYTLLFMGLLTFFYEKSMFDPTFLTVFRSALIHGLGFGALSCFAISYFVLALIVGAAVSNGTLVGLGH
jgi:hypothetical protein